jgi:hypothetical protein
MKITTTTQKTETVEIEINFPSFTKVKTPVSTAFYCIKSDNEIFRVEQYDGTKIVTVSNYSNTNFAFDDGFEFIDKSTFFENYNKIVAQMWEDMEQLEASLDEYDSETNEKQEDEGYEYNPETESMN